MRKYGWKRQLPDQRDRWYCSRECEISPPAKADLRAKMPNVYDQKGLGSCVGESITGVVEADLLREGSALKPSALFVYWGARSLEGTTDFDAGASIRDGIKFVAKKGVPPEALWPYDDSNPGPFQTKPPHEVFTVALQHRAISYKSVYQTAHEIKSCVAAGLPVAFGFTVYESFETEAVDTTGIVPMPGSDERALGGHAVVCCGYDDSKKQFLIRNSWGEKWGIGGYCWMPYDYVLDPNLASDFWVIKTVKI